MYRWRDLHDMEMKDGPSEFDLSKVISDLSDKKFEEQVRGRDRGI